MIQVSDLVKRYGERLAVDRASFAVQEGEVFGLLGPNGAGKTTTLSILSTLLEPDSGQATIGGYEVVRQAQLVKPLIGYVPQELALFPTLSARDNLAFFGRIYLLSGAALQARIAAVLELVGLSDRAGDAVRAFSGGMKRRLNIAIGLIHQPRVLFLDEPTVGVDPQSRNFIFEHIEQLKAEGMTVLYTTHYMEEAQRLCDRVAIMDAGHVLALDTTRNLIGLLGGGVVHVGLPVDAMSAMRPAIQDLPHVRDVSSLDDRLTIDTEDANLALLELIELCNTQDVPILSLEVLQPNLESVFLHLTGKRLRD
ncbi:MAG: ATP-binding cassette domain-containing protein [Anaerolineae bacterium]|nr:MAG: ATP-binding cassette domain-containing protein [Anaerolineae bacterium]